MLDSEGIASRSAGICESLKTAFPPREGMTVLSYLAAVGEANPCGYDEEVIEMGGRVAYPVCGEERSMEFYLPAENGEVRTGSYGIREPYPDEERRVDPSEADLVIVPCMGFDDKGDRLGHGGGYYDRYLPRCGFACRICVAFGEQKLDDVPTDEYDVRPDYVVTPDLIYRFQEI